MTSKEKATEILVNLMYRNTIVPPNENGVILDLGLTFEQAQRVAIMMWQETLDLCQCEWCAEGNEFDYRKVMEEIKNHPPIERKKFEFKNFDWNHFTVGTIEQ